MNWVLIVMFTMSVDAMSVITVPMQTEQGCHETLKQMKQFWQYRFEKGQCLQTK